MKTFLDGRVTLYPGECIEVMRSLPENSVDAVACDPPYHLTSIVKRFGADDAAPTKADGPTGVFKRSAAGFMGKQWDGGDIAFQVETWREVLRVLKPGGYLLSFASTRGFAEMSVAIQAAGFVTHPLTAFLTEHPDAQQFLSMLNKPQLDAFLRLCEHNDLGGILAWLFGSGFPKATRIKAPGYEGFRYGGQALKPAIEPIFMGQKPFSEATGTANILKYGTGAVNIDGCRIQGAGDVKPRGSSKLDTDMNEGWARPWMEDREKVKRAHDEAIQRANDMGRWPANLLHDGSEEVVAAFQDAPGQLRSSSDTDRSQGTVYGAIKVNGTQSYQPRDDGGSAARFFYSAKADSDDRIGSKHPTVKPVDLMRYLVRLVTPPGGVVLDPFAGTGTTGEAAWREGMRAILIEREPEYQADIVERMRLCLSGPDQKRHAIIKRKGLAEDSAGPLFEVSA